MIIIIIIIVNLDGTRVFYAIGGLPWVRSPVYGPYVIMCVRTVLCDTSYVRTYVSEDTQRISIRYLYYYIIYRVYAVCEMRDHCMSWDECRGKGR